MSNRVLVLREVSDDGIWLYRINVDKLKDAFIDSVDFEVFMEGVEMEESAVSLETVSEEEMEDVIELGKELY
jgi:hypothetical protein